MTDQHHSTELISPVERGRVLFTRGCGFAAVESYVRLFLISAQCCGIHPTLPLPDSKPRKTRRPSTKDMIRAAQQAGQPLTSITYPDGTKIDFTKPESTEPENPWLADLRKKETKQ
jgi:hypothetical protein